MYIIPYDFPFSLSLADKPTNAGLQTPTQSQTSILSTTTTDAGAVVSFQPTLSTATDQSTPVTTTSTAPAPDIRAGSQSSVIFGVGAAVGAAIALLLVMSVLGVALLIVWRRKNTSQPDLQPVPAIIVNGNVDHMDNPVYGGEQLYKEYKHEHSTKPLG